MPETSPSFSLNSGLSEAEFCANQQHNQGISCYTSFVRTGNLSDINEAILAEQEAINLTPDRHENMVSRLNNLGLYLQNRFERTESASDINDSISMLQQAIDLTPADHEGLPTWLNNLGLSLRSRFKRAKDPFDIDEAIAAQQRAVHLTPDGNTAISLWSRNLGGSFHSRFELTGDPLDLDQAIFAMQRAVNSTHPGDVLLPSTLNDLGVTLCDRFRSKKQLSDLDAGIIALREALNGPQEGNTEIALWLNNLGDALDIRFQQTRDLSDISEAISAKELAVSLTPKGYANMANRLRCLGISFRHRFDCTGDLSDLQSAIRALRQAINLNPSVHADLCTQLDTLGTSFQDLFRLTANVLDINKAISFQRKALALSDRGGMDILLNNLATSFQYRFERTKNLSDLNEAISTLRQAVDLNEELSAKEMHINYSSSNQEALSSFLQNLANSLHSRFQHTGHLPDLNESISAERLSVNSIPHGHADLAKRLNSLALSFKSRFDRIGNLLDLNEAISAMQRAVDITPSDHAQMPARLHNLGVAICTRFERTRQPSDVYEATDAHKRAIELAPAGYADMPLLWNRLAIALEYLTEVSRDISGLNEAISIHQKVVHFTTDDHPSKACLLMSLGCSFYDRFGRAGDLLDINEAISAQQRAVNLIPNSHELMPQWLNNLGVALLSRFEVTKDISHFNEAISTQQQAVIRTLIGHPELPHRVSNLACSHHSHFELKGDDTSLRLAASLYRLAAILPWGPPLRRFQAAREWASCSWMFDQSDSLKAYGVAIDILSQMVGFDQSNSMQQRHSILIPNSTISTKAAAAAFSLGRLDLALEWLEQGRCLVWNELNSLRISLDDSRVCDPALADDFLRVSSELEDMEYHLRPRMESGRLPDDAPELNMSPKISLQEKVLKHIKLVQERDELLAKIREKPKFRAFLRPHRSLDLLRNLPQEGSIVMININEHRCDALALLPGSDTPPTRHIPLDKLTFEKANSLRACLARHLSAHRLWMRETRGVHPMPATSRKTGLQYVLRELWKGIVKPVLDALGFSPSSNPSRRIWWCTTGPLAFLPIHAAGIYGQENTGPGSAVSDFAVSSYIPTVGELCREFKAPEKIDKKSQGLLLINQPHTKGLPSIPGTTKEIQAVQEQLKEKGFRTLCLEGSVATVDRVKEEMGSYSCIHFACHATQNIEHPLQSGFHLYGGQLDLLEISQKRLLNVDLAFLSACQTSTGYAELSDEAVHLAGGMLAAGYKGVVATMWSINDNHAPNVAKDFYAHLLKGGTPEKGKVLDGGLAALALHHACERLEKR